MQIVKIIHSQDLISVTPNAHVNRAMKIIPLLWLPPAPGLHKGIPVILTWRGGSSPSSWTLASAPMPRQRPAASRVPSSWLSSSQCLRAAGSLTPSPLGSVLLLLPAPQGHTYLQRVFHMLLCLKPASIQRCWGGCKAAAVLAEGCVLAATIVPSWSTAASSSLRKTSSRVVILTP